MIQLTRKKRKLTLNPMQMICVTFFLLIFIGAVLLFLPFSSADGTFSSFFDCLFTSTSASCVTGLVVCDTYSHWSIIGRTVIILLIQMGGLGVVTFTTVFIMSLRGKLGLRDMRLANEQISGSDFTNVQGLFGNIIKVTLAFELTGALLLCIPFCTRFGFNGIFISLFTSISAYCNAGFDVVGFIYPYCSLAPFNNDPIVIIVVSMLIICGGMGFIVMYDILKFVQGKKLRLRNLALHTKLVLTTTLFILVVSTVLIIIFEYSNAFAGMPFLQKAGNALFSTATARTAGYSMLDYSKVRSLTLILTTFVMFVGASPGSTGGGVKTTTIVILIMTMVCVLKRRQDTIIFNRRVSKQTVYKALTLVMIVFFLLLGSTLIVWNCEPGKPLLQLIFEVVSAFSTTGLSAVGTQNLTRISQTVLIILMYLGRVGPATFLLMFGLKSEPENKLAIPEGKVYVG